MARVPHCPGGSHRAFSRHYYLADSGDKDAAVEVYDPPQARLLYLRHRYRIDIVLN